MTCNARADCRIDPAHVFELSPDNDRDFYARANMHFDTHDYCEQSLRMAPNDPYTLDSRALAYLKLGNLDAAIADYDAALSAKPELDSSLYGRGLAKREKGDTAGAEHDIAAAKAINAGIADVFAHYGVE